MAPIRDCGREPYDPGPPETVRVGPVRIGGVGGHQNFELATTVQGAFAIVRVGDLVGELDVPPPARNRPRSLRAAHRPLFSRQPLRNA